MDGSFRTPRNAKNDSSFPTPGHLKKVSVNRFKTEDSLTSSNQKINFSQDFDSLVEIKNFEVTLSKKTIPNQF